MLVERYIHNKDWENAERVAETYDNSAIAEVLIEQAKDEFQNKNFPRFESLLLRAHKPEMIDRCYCAKGVDAHPVFPFRRKVVAN